VPQSKKRQKKVADNFGLQQLDEKAEREGKKKGKVRRRRKILKQRKSPAFQQTSPRGGIQ